MINRKIPHGAFVHTSFINQHSQNFTEREWKIVRVGSNLCLTNRICICRGMKNYPGLLVFPSLSLKFGSLEYSFFSQKVLTYFLHLKRIDKSGMFSIKFPGAMIFFLMFLACAGLKNYTKTMENFYTSPKYSAKYWAIET